MFNYSSTLSISSGMIRSTALLVFLISVFFLLTGSSIPVLFLSVDFLIRAAGKSRWSPLAKFSAKFLAPRMRFFKGFSRVNPKRFAALIGFIFSAGATVFLFSGYQAMAFVFISTLAFFSFLEAAFNFCAGCKMYGLLIKFGFIEDEICEDCQINFRRNNAA